MVTYTIYQLDESDITISGGVGLDGVTQGDGSHLVGETITLNSNNWFGVNISDNDSDFADNDTSQTLNGGQTIDGVFYGNGTGVEAEYSFTVTDGTNTWTLVAFNVDNSSPRYGTVEGIAFIGGEGGFPPTGVELTIVSAAEGPSFPAADYAYPFCFTTGTLILTPNGERAIEDLQVGDMVLTSENGQRPIRWIGRRDVAALGKFAAVRIKAGAYGNTRDLLVSQQHRMLIQDWRNELFFLQDKVLVAAKHLINDTDVRLEEGGRVTYIHLLFDDHEIIWAEGALTESLHPGTVAISAMDRAARDEVLTLFPELETSEPRPMAAYVLKAFEARVIV